jgi:hypothetical protein
MCCFYWTCKLAIHVSADRWKKQQPGLQWGFDRMLPLQVCVLGLFAPGVVEEEYRKKEGLWHRWASPTLRTSKLAESLYIEKEALWGFRFKLIVVFPFLIPVLHIDLRK